jgi:hypothetical protein
MYPQEDSELQPIRHVKKFDELSADILSQPTRELEKRIKILEDSLSSIARKGTVTNVLLKNKPVNSEVKLYSCVFFNKVTSVYEPTLAKVEFTGTSFKTMRSGLVMGIVVKLIGNVADILVDGFWPNSALLGSNNLLESGESYIPGVPYYVSARERGKVTSRVPAIAIQVFIGEQDDLVINKVYNSPLGYETSARFEMGMRPIGDLLIQAADTSIIGFHALEYDGTAYWDSTADNADYATSGYMVAEGFSKGYIEDPIWVEITVKNTGALAVRTSDKLATLDDADPTDYEDTAASATQPFAVSLTNYSALRTLVLTNSNAEEIYKLQFKFVTSGTFDISKERKVLFKVPHSFTGWKELQPGDPTLQIQPYYSEVLPSDYPDYSHNPSDVSSFYYDTKADIGFVNNWPPEPIEKTIIMMNGVELPVAKLVPNGASSQFSEEFTNIGGSEKTIYWGTSFGSTLPWDIAYKRLATHADATERETAKIPHCPSASGECWYWNEDTYSSEPYQNRGWVYSNKLSVYYKSTRVMGVGVMPPLKIQDTLTGLEPSYDGEPITGNLMIWSEAQDNVSEKVPSIQLGLLQQSAVPIFTNTTKFNVILKEVMFVVNSQNNAQLTNEAIGVDFTAENSAKINLGTGLVGLSVSNILKATPTNVYNYNTYSVITIGSGAAVVAPGGVVNLTLDTSFPVEQSVSVISSGRIV